MASNGMESMGTRISAGRWDLYVQDGLFGQLHVSGMVPSISFSQTPNNAP